jgi:hypothetical protein
MGEDDNHLANKRLRGAARKGDAPYGVLTRRRVLASAIGLVIVIVILAFLVGRYASREHGHFDWELASLFGTAIGTTGLAVATGALAYATSGDVRASWHLAELTRADQAAREQPHVVVQVLAWTLVGTKDLGELVLSLRNVGLGPALRVEYKAFYEPDQEAVPLPQFGILPALMPGETNTVTWSGVRWRADLGTPYEGGFRVTGTYYSRTWSQVYPISVDTTDPRRSLPGLS